jgi:hypothetical protein
MGFKEDARETRVKKKVEEGKRFPPSLSLSLLALFSALR